MEELEVRVAELGDVDQMVLVAGIVEVGGLMGQTWCPGWQRRTASRLAGKLVSVWLGCWVWVGRKLDCWVLVDMIQGCLGQVEMTLEDRVLVDTMLDCWA